MSDDGVLVLLVLAAVASSGGAPAGPRAPRTPAALPPPKPPAGSKWTDDDLREFRRIGRNLGLNDSDLEAVLLLFAVESSLDPSAARGASYGLHQAQAPLLRAVGWKAEPSAFASLTVKSQLPWVAKMLERQVRFIARKPTDAADWLRLNLSPVAAREESDVVYDTSPKWFRLYEANKRLDLNKDGRIDMSDLRKHVADVATKRLYQSHLKRLNEVR